MVTLSIDLPNTLPNGRQMIRAAFVTLLFLSEAFSLEFFDPRMDKAKKVTYIEATEIFESSPILDIYKSKDIITRILVGQKGKTNCKSTSEGENSCWVTTDSLIMQYVEKPSDGRYLVYFRTNGGKIGILGDKIKVGMNWTDFIQVTKLPKSIAKTGDSGVSIDGGVVYFHFNNGILTEIVFVSEV